MWGGVDAWKEEMTILTEGIARQGFATIALDNVGTGQAPIKAGPDGERPFFPVLHRIEQSGRFDVGRIACRALLRLTLGDQAGSPLP